MNSIGTFFFHHPSNWLAT